jgi:hypothetical protein
MHRLLPLLLLAACARSYVRGAVIDPGAGNVREVTLEVRNESERPLDPPRPGLIDQVGRLFGRTPAPFSAVDAFTAAAMIELEQRGIHARADRRPEAPTFRIAIRDLEIRNRAEADAVAFVSASYVLADATGESLWEAVEQRMPIRLGGPDLTSSQLTRIAAEAVRRALSSFPMPDR